MQELEKKWERIATDLRPAIKAYGMAKLGKELHINIATLSRFCAGKEKMGLKRLYKIQRHLAQNFGDLTEQILKIQKTLKEDIDD